MMKNKSVLKWIIPLIFLMVLNDIEVSVIELTVFPALTLANIVMAFFLLKNLDSREPGSLLAKTV